MSEFLLVLPLVVTLLLLLPPFRAHVIVAGFVGGILAMIIGGLSVGQATGLFTEGVTRLFGIAPVILFASTSIVLARAGSMASTLSLLKRGLKGRVEFIAPAMVIVQALAVYAAGSGAANTLVTAPLLFAAIGFNPYVLGGLSIASAGAWACSPSAAETAFISEAMQMSVTDYVAFMRPYAVVLWILGAVIAYIGVVKAKKAGAIRPGYSPEETLDNVEVANASASILGDPKTADWKRATPFFVLLALLVSSPVVNKLIGVPVLTTFTIPFIVLILVGLLAKINFNDLGKEFVNGSKTILGYLFMVGVFLGFTNMLTQIGTFDVIAKLPGGLPVALIGIGGLIVAFLIAIPAAAYTTAVLIITVPVMQAIGIPTVMFGFMTLIVAQGAMISPVQVNVAASAHGFKISILRVVSNNLRFIPIAAVIVIIMSQISKLFS